MVGIAGNIEGNKNFNDGKGFFLPQQPGGSCPAPTLLSPRCLPPPAPFDPQVEKTLGRNSARLAQRPLSSLFLVSATNKNEISYKTARAGEGKPFPFVLLHREQPEVADLPGARLGLLFSWL